MTTTFDLAYVRREEEPVLPPPRGRISGIEAVYAGLFSSFTNIVLTVIGLALIIMVVPPIVRWAFIDAVWTGNSREACIAPEAGACWAFVKAKFAQFMYGRYPVEERWRVELTAVLLIIGLVPMAIPRVPFKRQNAIYLLALFPLMALILLTGGNFDIPVGIFRLVAALACFAVGLTAMFVASHPAAAALRMLAATAALLGMVLVIAALALGRVGPAILGYTIIEIAVIAAALVAFFAGVAAILAGEGAYGARRILPLGITTAAVVVVLLVLRADFGLTWVETPLWGGLLVTLVVAIVGMVGSMPLGILLALGRRSKLPVVRFVSIAFIEFVRGVPLITVLFMASVMLPLFLPPGVNFDKLLRALIGVTLFSAAYMAEVVRGGLQAIPRGQYEAASALGMGYWQSMRLIILPQALKIVIPGIVNSFISLFKDTSLVLIIGIFDLLGIVQLNFTDPNWASPNTPATGYVFAAAVFWLFCFSMSRYSIYTERRLDTGHRR
ncbi:MAG TPA: amino acid ABC transporter permease [Bauldia sp.]|nr:amino acid ABC transporter permease [Bauldia sp.]